MKRAPSAAVGDATTAKPMVVAGVMSGTSADGVDVALVRIAPGRAAARPKLKLLGHLHVSYPSKLRTAVLAAMDAQSIATSELARLHWRLGEVYGDAVLAAQEKLGIRAKLIGVHGQTVYHQGIARKYLGAELRCTWQLGEAAETAARTRLPVVSDFRPADMASSGQGAPLVPMLDRVLYTHPTRNRILQNLGGIANMTALPAGSDAVLAFDSGPANVVIDLVMHRLYGRRFDRNGAVASKGHALQSVIDALLVMPYFSLPAPKSCGREEFGNSFVAGFLEQCRKADATDDDIVATATALTAQSILHAYRTLVWPFLAQNSPLAEATDYIVAGGGTRNTTLLRLLRTGLEPLGIEVKTSDTAGIPAEAKEAVAFALLAWLRWHGLPGNVPAATGARHSVLLGKVTL